MNIKKLFLLSLLIIAGITKTENEQKDVPTTLSAFFKENPEAEISFDLTQPTTLTEFFEQNPLADVAFRPELPEERIQLIKELEYNRWRNSTLLTLSQIDKGNIDEKLSLYPNKKIADGIKKIEFEKLTPNIYGIIKGDNEYLEKEVKREKGVLEKNISKKHELEALKSQIGPDNVDSWFTRFGNFISDNKIASITAGIVIVCAAGYAAYNWYKERNKKSVKKQAKNN